MVKATVWLVGVLALLSACGDRQEKKAAEATPAPAPPQSPSAPSSATPPRQRQPDAPPPIAPQRVSVELGYEVDELGSVPAALSSREFAAGSPFVLAVRAPEGGTDAEVTVRWLDERDTALGTQTLRFANGREFLDFSGPDTSSWRSGPYKVEVRVGAGAPTSIAFSIARGGESQS